MFLVLVAVLVAVAGGCAVTLAAFLLACMWPCLLTSAVLGLSLSLVWGSLF